MNLTTRAITAAVLFQSLFLAFSPSSAPADTLYWSGDGTTEGGAGTWDTNSMRFGTSAGGPFSTIWSNANSDNAVFEAAAGIVTNSSASPITLNGTLTDNSGYTFTNSAITLGTNPSTPAIFVAAGKTLTMSSVLAGPGAFLIKNGPGVFILNSQSTYTGGTVHNAGTLGFGNVGTITYGNNTPANKLTINADNVVIANSTTSSRTPQASVDQLGDLIVDNSLAATPGIITYSGAQGPWTIKGANHKITVNGTTTTLAIGAVIQDDGIPRSLTKAGNGKLQITAAAGANTYRGDTTISAGTLTINGTSTLGDATGTLHLSGGTLTSTASRSTTTAPVANPLDVTADSAITTTSTAATCDLNLTGTVTAGAGTTLTFRSDAASGGFNPRFSGGFTYAGKIAINNNNGSGTATTTLNLFNTSGNDQTFNDVISGTGSIKRSASAAGTGGQTTMNAANIYAGGTTLNDGGIGLGVDSAGTPPTITSGPIGTGTLTVSLFVSGLPTLFTSGGERTLGNAITLNNTAAALIVSNADRLTLSGQITGTGGLSKTGAGQLRLSPPANLNNTYSGGTTNSGGEIAFDSNSSGGVPDAPAIGPVGQGPLYAANGCAFSPLSRSRTVANHFVFLGSSCTFNGGSNLTFTGTTDLGGNTVAMTVNIAGTNVLNLAGAVTNGGLTKAGGGTLVLGGANTYTGPTTVSQGTVKVTGNTSSSAFGVAAGATLAGSGTVGTVDLSGTISPGGSPGTLNSSGQNWNGGGHYAWELNSVSGSAGSDPGWDTLNIVGSLNITATSGSKFVLDITSLTLADVAGSVPDFDNTATYAWSIAKTTTGITGFDPHNFTLNTANFANGLGDGAFIITTNATDVILRFVHRPSVTSTGAGQGTFIGAPNATYTVQYANSLNPPVNWQTLMTVTTDGAGSGSFTDASAPGGQPQRFYRVAYP
jgi:autotransporter-associated beta strand protein